MDFLRKLFGTKKDKVTQRKDHPDVYHVPGEEERMNWAMEKAKLTLQYFKESLISPRGDQQYFSLKAKIVDGQEIEHIWLNDVSFDDVDIFYGSIGNAPLSIRNVSIGTKVGVDRDSISDWMILENGRLIGGYTIRCLRDAMPEKAQKNFDRTLGFFIDEGVDHFEHDLSTPEGAILSIEDAYDAQDLDRIMACKDFEMEASFMLDQKKELQRLAKDQAIVTETAKAFKLNFIKFIDEQGFPSFADITRAFPKREFITPTICVITEVCYYPDRTKSIERIYVGRRGSQWFVLNPAD